MSIKRKKTVKEVKCVASVTPFIRSIQKRRQWKRGQWKKSKKPPNEWRERERKDWKLWGVRDGERECVCVCAKERERVRERERDKGVKEKRPLHTFQKINLIVRLDAEKGVILVAILFGRPPALFYYSARLSLASNNNSFVENAEALSLMLSRPAEIRFIAFSVFFCLVMNYLTEKKK